MDHGPQLDGLEVTQYNPGRLTLVSGDMLTISMPIEMAPVSLRGSSHAHALVQVWGRREAE